MSKESVEYSLRLSQKFNEKLGIISLDNFSEPFNLEIMQKHKIKKVKDIVEEYSLNIEDVFIGERVYTLITNFSIYAAISNMPKRYFERYLFSFYFGIQKDMLNELTKIFQKHKDSFKVIDIINNFENIKFVDLIIETFLYSRKTNSLRDLLTISGNVPEDAKKVRTEINNIVSRYNFDKKSNLYKCLTDICITLKNLNLTYIEDDGKINKEKLGKTKEETLKEQKPIDFRTVHITQRTKKIFEKLGISDLLNPDLTYIKKINDRYTKFCNSLDDNNAVCDLIKTAIYASAYLTKDKFESGYFYPIDRMKNITETSSRWAVGDEHNEKVSFYGESEFAKAFAGYYAFMNAKRNPYYQIINNNLVNYIDEEAAKMHKYFKENGLSKMIYEMLYEKPIAGNDSFYDLLGKALDLIEVLEKPIYITSLGDGILNQIKGYISGILNSVAQLLDFSISFTLKELFYIDFIPIENLRLSVADIYNYMIFLKLIFENSGNLDVSAISREQFVSAAYAALGVREKDIQKIGYCSFDYELNDKTGLNFYNEYLYAAKDGEPFVARHHLKLLYSLIKFGIQKKVFNTGNANFFYDFNYGNINGIKSILNSLTTQEIFYVFSLYGLRFDGDSVDYASLTKEEVIEYNVNLRDISIIYNHNSTDFYSAYAKKNEEYFKYNSFYEAFLTVNYKSIINEMLKIYGQVLSSNKGNIDKIVFSQNDITDIDDFVMRILPSLIEFCKLLGVKNIGVEYIVKILDYCCYFISELMFRNICLKFKFKLADLMKLFSENVFNYLDTFKDDEQDYVINFDFSSEILKNKITDIMDFIDTVTLTSTEFQNCFTFPDFRLNEDYKEVIGDVDFDHVIINKIDINNSGITTNPFGDYNDNVIVNKHDLTKKPNRNLSKQDEDILNKIIKPVSEPKKLIYNNGAIYIEDKDNNRIKVVYNEDSKKDQNGISKQTLSPAEINKITNNNLNQFETMIEIRDFIQNATNANIVKIINKLSKIDKEISLEIEKKNPNFQKVQKLQKEYQNLTNELESAKKENNMIVSNETISKQPFYSINSDIIISSDYEVDLQEKKELLEEVEDIVIKNNSPLTNFEIIQLLK